MVQVIVAEKLVIFVAVTAEITGGLVGSDVVVIVADVDVIAVGAGPIVSKVKLAEVDVTPDALVDTTW